MKRRSGDYIGFADHQGAITKWKALREDSFGRAVITIFSSLL
jgi:hypothetical protein